MTKYPPATREAFDDLALWILQMRLGGKADPSLLIRSLPLGPILGAVITEDGAFAVDFRDQQDPSRKRTPRIFDAVAFAALLALCVPKAHLTISRTDIPPRAELHDLTFGDHIKVRRIIADARSGDAVEQIGDHYDLRRSNLRIVPAPPDATHNWSHKGRAAAIETALENFERALVDHLPLTLDGYRWMLRQVFELVDRVPIGDRSDDAGAATR